MTWFGKSTPEHLLAMLAYAISTFMAQSEIYLWYMHHDRYIQDSYTTSWSLNLTYLATPRSTSCRSRHDDTKRNGQWWTFKVDLDKHSRYDIILWLTCTCVMWHIGDISCDMLHKRLQWTPADRQPWLLQPTARVSLSDADAWGGLNLMHICAYDSGQDIVAELKRSKPVTAAPTTGRAAWIQSTGRSCQLQAILKLEDLPPTSKSNAE